MTGLFVRVAKSIERDDWPMRLVGTCAGHAAFAWQR